MRLHTKETSRHTFADYADTSMYVIQRLHYDPDMYGSSHLLADNLQIKIMNNWAFSPLVREEATTRLREAFEHASLMFIEMEVTLHGLTGSVYVIGPHTGVDAGVTRLQEWVDGGCEAIEEIDFAAAFAATYQTVQVERCSTNVWWSYTDGVLWTLRRSTAAILIHSLRDIVVE